ncbi:uncharacterized protein LOC131009052 [Salvia miltiorrhiza]|uniref:uncharacterized protein LOC131009052 n=1 Tax=Salvia miltiorrhiza TaxID=226208 RepID=UPI0025ABFC66|nr:uncharacterized protein LOC131009052 [Salvia miltiorrhiza]
MAGTCIRVMVVILCLYFHMSLNGAIPFTRSSNLVQKIQNGQVAEGSLLENPNLVMRRMEIEVNDYPGSGANNRHTPRPQLGRGGCSDC